MKSVLLVLGQDILTKAARYLSNLLKKTIPFSENLYSCSFVLAIQGDRSLINVI